jgi:drug/metabolite transporter (DMT)-like permease
MTTTRAGSSLAGRLPRTRAAGIALAFVTALVSGVAVFVNGYAVKAFGNADVYTTAKNLVAAALLAGLAAVAARRGFSDRPTRPRTRRQWLGLAAVALVGGSVPFLLFFEGLARASSVQAAFIHKTLVVWVALLAVPLLSERIGPAHLAAIALLVWGQAVLGGGVGGVRPGLGEAMILAATVAWAVEVIVAKRLLTDLASPTVGVARMGLGVLVLVGWLAVSGQAGALVGLGGRQWAWALATGVILSVYVATWYAALARAPAVDVTAVLVVGAVVTALLDAAVNGKALAPQGLGLVLVTAGGLLIVAARRLRAGRPAAG